MVVSLLSGQSALAVIAVAPLCLALVPSVNTARRAKVDIVVDRERCFETEAVRVQGVLVADQPVTTTMRLRTPDGIAITHESPVVFASGAKVTGEWELRADRWGRRALGPVIATMYSDGFLLTSTAHSRVASLSVFPTAALLRQLPLPRALPPNMGDHVSRGIGDGVEFAGARPMVAGDFARRMNWRATARYGRPFVTQFYTERSTDVVLIVDGLSEVGEPGRTTIDISVRGAAALARSYLTTHDQVGVIALGGVLHWVTRQGGMGQLYRVLETLMEVRDFVSVVRPALDRLPRVALPPGALVVMFTPLLDPRSIEVARHLRERGLPLVVIDVLAVEPAIAPKFPTSELALRIWRLERRAMIGRLIELGAHVVRWDGQSPLEIPLGALRSLGRLA